VVQVVSKQALVHGRRKIDVGREESSDVHFARGATDGPDLMLLENAEQFHLHVAAHFSDLVEEQSSTVRLDKDTRMISVRPRERASNMSE
jgi:hypothetical protein